MTTQEISTRLRELSASWERATKLLTHNEIAAQVLRSAQVDIDRLVQKIESESETSRECCGCQQGGGKS